MGEIEYNDESYPMLTDTAGWTESVKSDQKMNDEMDQWERTEGVNFWRRNIVARWATTTVSFMAAFSILKKYNVREYYVIIVAIIQY